MVARSVKTPEWALVGVLGVAAIVVAGAALVVSIQIGRVSDLSGDVRGAAARIDQIYPLLANQATDIGKIQGSLQASAERLAETSEKLKDVADRLGQAVKSQETLADSVKQLAEAVKTSGAKLDSIESKVDALSLAGPLKKSNFWTSTFVVPPVGLSPEILSELKESGAQVYGWQTDPTDFWQGGLRAVKMENIDVVDTSKFWIGTDDPKAAEALKKLIGAR